MSHLACLALRMTSWPIRTAVPAERARLREIFWQASLTNEGDRAALLAGAKDHVLPDAPLDEGRIRVATDSEGTIVGFATALTTSTSEVVELEDLFVDPEWMRRGIATALIQDAVDLAGKAGVHRIEVTGNAHALAFYESAGFVINGEVATPLGGVGLRMHLDLQQVTDDRRR